jgi:hypothetical protein
MREERYNMRTKMFAILIFFLWVVPCFAQVDTAWVRRYNGAGNDVDKPVGIAVDNSGNVYVTGGSIGNGTYFDYVTLRYYPDGDTAWIRRYAEYGGGGYQAPTAIAVDGSGNVYVTGQNQGDYLTIKYYSNAETAWVRTYDGPRHDNDIA